MHTGILEQCRQARRHPIAAMLGALLGGFVPVAAYQTTHGDLHVSSPTGLLHPLVPVVAACLLFSVRTVWQWGRGAFGEPLKASCLVIAIEGMMVFSPSVWLARLALCYLIVINAVATACILAADDTPAPPVTAAPVARDQSPRRAAAKLVDQEVVVARSAGPRAPRVPA